MSWDKGAEPLRKTINVLFEEKNSKQTRCFALPSRCAATTKLLVNSAERSRKWGHSNDEETGDNAVKRLKMLSSTAVQKASVAPTVIYAAWRTRRIKKRMKTRLHPVK
jgi:hypothetical protein